MFHIASRFHVMLCMETAAWSSPILCAAKKTSVYNVALRLTARSSAADSVDDHFWSLITSHIFLPLCWRQSYSRSCWRQKAVLPLCMQIEKTAVSKSNHLSSIQFSRQGLYILILIKMSPPFSFPFDQHISAWGEVRALQYHLLVTDVTNECKIPCFLK